MIVKTYRVHFPVLILTQRTRRINSNPSFLPVTHTLFTCTGTCTYMHVYVLRDLVSHKNQCLSTCISSPRNSMPHSIAHSLFLCRHLSLPLISITTYHQFTTYVLWYLADKAINCKVDKYVHA